jgi:hypothetical protein
MSKLSLLVERSKPFETISEAIGPLVALAAALGSQSAGGCLWTMFEGRHFALQREAIELLLVQAWSGHADRESEPTHVLPLGAIRGDEYGLGVLAVTIREGPGTSRGVRMMLSLPEAVFDTGVTRLSLLLEQCVDAVAADLAGIGPRPWLRELRVGWATFARQVRRDLLPLGVLVHPTKSGSLVVAHTEEPASESASARESIARVRAAIHGDPPASPSAPPAVPPAPPPAIAPLQPSYLAAPPVQIEIASPRRVRPPAELAGTSLAVELPRGPDLPFARNAGQEPSPCCVPTAPHPRRARPPAELSGTLDAVDAPRGPALPFAGTPPGDQTPPAPGVPDLTVDQYALLRAHLALKGEEDAETWHDFGISSLAVKEALQAHFAARFRQDPAAQARFVELVQRYQNESSNRAVKR